MSQLPHYMILDDHELWDSYGTERDGEAEARRKPALAAYDEYVASRQPQQPTPGERYYRFEHGDSRFFVLDTRTERTRPEGDAPGRMIGNRQMDALDAWLQEEGDGPRFIVSSVPFVAELRPPGLDSKGVRRADERADKWSAPSWRGQREAIIARIYEYGVERLVFLVGDMHCTYHATMQLGGPRRRFTIHELAGGPFNQLQFAERHQFYSRYTGSFAPLGTSSEEDRLPSVSTMQAFHGAAPSVLEVSVAPREGNAPPRVDWRALRTHAPARTNGSTKQPPPNPHDLCGTINFHRRPVGARNGAG